MKLKKYQNFLESRGVATETTKYTDVILKLLKDKFKQFVSSGSDTHEEKLELTKDYFPFYSESYPISEIELNINFDQMSDEAFEKRCPGTHAQGKYFSTTGICYSVGETDGSVKLEDGSIRLKMGVGAIIDKEKIPTISDSLIEEINLEIESSITHELNHSYDAFNRDLKGEPGFGCALTWALDPNMANVPDSVWKIWWKELGYFLYWTEGHEINAMTQDAFPYIKKYDIEEMKGKTPTWDFIQRMKKFDPIEFKNRLTEEIKKTMSGQDPDEVLTKMKDGLADKLQELVDDEDATMEEYPELKYSKPSISSKFIRKLNIDQFLDFCGKRIQKMSEKLRRRVLRHYSSK